jgi:hypothetical protein
VSDDVKSLFLLSLSGLASITVVALSGIVARGNALSGFELFVRRPESLIWFGGLLWKWAALVNDVAAANGVSKILGRTVEFRETNLYSQGSGQLVSSWTKLFVIYPGLIAFFFVAMTVEISRS